MLLLMLLGVLSLTIVTGACPLSCGCSTDSMQCYSVDLTQVYYDSSLITTITFMDSVVDFNIIVEKFHNLESATFVTSRVLNCPKTTDIIIQVCTIS